MKNRNTSFLKLAIFVIGMAVLLLCLFFLPWVAATIAKQNPEWRYLRFPILIGIYLTTLPFYLALFEGFRLLIHIERDQAFSQQGVLALNHIKYCAIVIAILYGIGAATLLFLNSLIPMMILLSSIIIFASVSIGIFAAVLQELLKQALAIKSENDLTV